MKKRVNKISVIIVLFLTNLILCLYYYFKKYISTVNFISILFHITNNAQGQGTLNVILDGLKSCYMFMIIIVVIEIMLFTNFKSKVYIKYKKNNKSYLVYPTIIAKYKLVFSVILLFLSCFLLFEKVNFREYIKMAKSNTKIYEMCYVETNSVDITFEGNKRNLILLYLESMESSLFSKENNGAFEVSRIPELEKLAKENINFSNKDGLGGMLQLDSTSFTIGSFVASTSSTPLLSGGYNTSQEKKQSFSNVKTLGDVLSSNNYNLEFMQGSDIKFSGTDKYLKNHGNYNIFDYNTAKERNYISDNYFVWWGVEDKKLFEYAKKDIIELANKENPFAFTMFTIDTHFKDGYLDSSCDNKFSDKMSNSFACSSKKVYEFVNWIKKQDFYDNTMIVILGDHVTMQSSYYEKAPNYQRTVYNVFINSKKENVNSKNRLVSGFDIYPTILSGLGASMSSNKIGFGTNLFSSEKTNLEIYGYDYFKEELKKKSNYYYKKIF